MATHQNAQLIAEQNRTLKASHRAMCAMGDYHVRKGHDLGPRTDPRRGVRDLTGSASARRRYGDRHHGHPSALTPENFEAGRREARAQGVELEWMEGDAETLPFGNDEFDVVTSSFGAMLLRIIRQWPISC
jgi:hypothetical protein